MTKDKLNMKPLINRLIKTIFVLMFLLTWCCKTACAMRPPLTGQDFSISVRNITQTSDRTFEFDLYLLDTDPAQTFELASVQCGITVNPSIYSGGTFSASLVPATSGLNPAQVPTSVTYTTGTGANIVKVSATTPPGSGNGTILSYTTPGTRIARLKLTSTVAFPSNSLPNLAFTSSSAIVMAYATRVAIYQGGVNTQLVVTPGSNAMVLENPTLNPSFPVAYAVTGGGTCCDNSGGLPVGLSGSQVGVTYTLYRNNVLVTTMAGSGSVMNFPGNQIAGTYTVIGTNLNGTSPMLNSVMVLMNPSPVPAITSNTPVCAGSPLNLTGGPASMSSYLWAGPNGFTSAIQSPSIANPTILASGIYSLTVTNSFGCAASTTTPSGIVVYALPLPTITGPASTCAGSTGINYSTESSMSGYSWSVTGGSITTGSGTSAISVTWGLAGTGQVSVTYSNGNLCQASAPTTKNIIITTVPVNQRSLNNVTVVSGQSLCADAGQTIFVAGGGTTFTVAAGGISHLVAGQNIILYPGSTVQSGGYLHAYISNDCLYCNAPKSAIVASTGDSLSNTDRTLVAGGNDLFRVFPNPTSGSFTLEILRPVENLPVHVEIFGMQGTSIINTEMNNHKSQSFDLGHYPSGIYLIRVMAGSDENTGRILKN